MATSSSRFLALMLLTGLFDVFAIVFGLNGALDYVFTQTLLGTHPEINIIR